MFFLLLAGGIKMPYRLINNLQLISHLANVGDAKTLMIHLAATYTWNSFEEAKIELRCGSRIALPSAGILEYLRYQSRFGAGTCWL